MKYPFLAWLLLLAALIAGLSPQPAGAEKDLRAYTVEAPEDVAQDLTRRCRADAAKSVQHYAWRITDDLLHSSLVLKAGQWAGIRWDEDVPVKAVWIAFMDYPKAYRVQQLDGNGTVLKEEPGLGFVDHTLFLEAETRAVTVLAEGKCDIAAMYAYGEGTVPHYHPWEPTPEKLDYLTIAMHPDDDVLFLGAIVPLYTVDQGREGSIYYTATQDRGRKSEAMDGAWVMGLRKAPILGTFMNIAPENREKYQERFTEDQVTLSLVRLLRKYRPEVVFSHDIYGEYGHWQHALLSKAVKRAVTLAARQSYDRQSADEYGVWQVKKLYLHLYAENKISLPVEKPIAAYGGLTPVEIASAAFECHQSQMPSRHAVRNEGVYSLSDFGLAYTAVGPDTPGVNDPFEHIDPETIHGTGTAEP